MAVAAIQANWLRTPTVCASARAGIPRAPLTDAASAQAVGDDDRVQALRGRRADFVRGHMSQWVPRFASDVLGATSHDFIRATVALLLALLVDDEASQLED